MERENFSISLEDDHQQQKLPDAPKIHHFMANSSSSPFFSLSGGAAAAAAFRAESEISSCSTGRKEHMFDKVVTPSDVGKLNRLVIPKQHAETCFPLSGAATEKGLVLSFEDSDGKTWRFRYSYWKSSQSYVMTKGWSRFVKDKRLIAGDTVSFSRSTDETCRDRILYIDWKRRPDRICGHPLRVGLPITQPWRSTMYSTHDHRQARAYGYLNYFGRPPPAVPGAPWPAVPGAPWPAVPGAPWTAVPGAPWTAVPGAPWTAVPRAPWTAVQQQRAGDVAVVRNRREELKKVRIFGVDLEYYPESQIVHASGGGWDDDRRQAGVSTELQLLPPAPAPSFLPFYP